MSGHGIPSGMIRKPVDAGPFWFAGPVGVDLASFADVRALAAHVLAIAGGQRLRLRYPVVLSRTDLTHAPVVAVDLVGEDPETLPPRLGYAYAGDDDQARERLSAALRAAVSQTSDTQEKAA